jgi:hypothetical protein
MIVRTDEYKVADSRKRHQEMDGRVLVHTGPCGLIALANGRYADEKPNGRSVAGSVSSPFQKAAFRRVERS